MKVVWTRRAIRQLVALRGHIAKGSEQNEAVVARRILEAVDFLEPQPEIGRPGRILGTRVRKGRIELIAIFDGHQQWPGKL